VFHWAYLIPHYLSSGEILYEYETFTAEIAIYTWYWINRQFI